MRDCSRSARDWGRLWILVVMFALTLNLATRYWAPGAVEVHAKKSLQHQSPEAKRQHLNRDAAQWAAPLVNFSILLNVSVGAPMANPGALPQAQILDSSLCNRPPPLFSAFNL
jgi:hypothetical protein